MNRNIKVSQKHRYTKDRNILYKGEAKIHNNDEFLKLSYIESTGATITLQAYANYMELIREHQDMKTSLIFRQEQCSEGSVTSNLGTIPITVKTFKYIKNDKMIALEYDIMIQDEVSDGFVIIWNLTEELHE